MTDFRNLTQPHDLRSQLGLIPGRRAAEFSELIGDALRSDSKPLNPADATPDPLHRTIAAMGSLGNSHAMRTAMAASRRLRPNGTSNVVVNVTNNGEQRMDKDASEIVASIRKMIDSPGAQHMRVHPGQAIQLDETQVSEMHLDVRAIANLIPEGAVLIKGFTVNEYLAAHPGNDPLIAKEGDITTAHPITEDLASVLRGSGLYTAGGQVDPPGVGKLYATGGPVGKPTHRALSKIHDHVESLESDILEALVMAGANPHADRRRLESARTQFELAFMMMKKAVDPEQERQ